MKKFFTNLKTKAIKLLAMAVIFMITTGIESCQKEPNREEIIENHRKEINENLQTENRNGTHALIYADSSGVIFNTNPNDSSQTVINLAEVDSITYESFAPYRDLIYTSIYCWEYEITFYSGSDTYTVIAYAKYRGATYKQVPGALEGLPVAFFYANFVRTSETIPYWDWGCMKGKFMHRYNIRKREDGQTSFETEFIQASVCTTSIVNFKRLFKR